MKGKKAKTPGAKSKKPTKKSTGKRTKKSKNELDDPGIILIEDDLEVDKEKELEERRAYLEEARSQDASE
jgi:hypothetical protein